MDTRDRSPGTARRWSDRPTDRPRHRRGWLRPLAGTVAVLAVATGAAAAIFHLGLPWWSSEGDHHHVHEGEAGSQRYLVHLPPQYDGTLELPVVMAIHGCGMSGFGWNSMKALTQLDDVADREGFIVVYPTQRLFRDALNCWSSADPREQHRHTGEPALLAGVAREVVETYGADPDQVHVAGASSGAGTAVILAVTHPDVFATVTSVAGGEYGLDRVDPDDPGATPPEYTARQAWSQMGDRARQVPLLVVQGQEDDVVPPLVATRLVRQWTALGDLVDDEVLNDSLGLTEETASVPAAEGRHAYVHTTITTRDDDAFVVESYVVEGMGHAWPGPSGEGLFADRAGPDASAILWDFARRHPREPSS